MDTYILFLAVLPVAFGVMRYWRMREKGQWVQLRLTDAFRGEADDEPSCIPRFMRDPTWVRPPDDVHDPSAWDLFWQLQVEHGGFAVAVADMMASDDHLVELLERRGVRTILCAGNGHRARLQHLHKWGST